MQLPLLALEVDILMFQVLWEPQARFGDVTLDVKASESRPHPIDTLLSRPERRKLM